MLEDGSGLHDHCLNCFRRDCTDYYVNYCPLVACQNNCGSLFHACKREEHDLVCSKFMLPCINSHYGCPFTLPRKDMLHHLEVCPASTIVCTMEWSRHVEEKNYVTSVTNFNPCELNEDHLDFAAALNDQCVAMNWLRKMKELGHSFKDQIAEEPVHEQAAMSYKDYQIMLYLQTEKAAQFAANDYSGYPYFDGNAANATPVEQRPPVESRSTSESSNTSTPVPELQDSENICYRTLQENTYRGGLGVDFHGHAIEALMDLHPCGVTLHQNHQEDDCKVLGLKKVIEFLPRYDTKHGGMYTFMCNTLLRRDEYCGHYQNFHCDFHGSLNGWLEERCPYHLYGCQYSRMRFSHHPGGKFVFDTVKNCVAVRMFDSDISTSDMIPDDAINVLNLPWEILQKIVSFLDSYSIGQLAATCLYLRGVCMSLLRDRGIVEMQWESFKGERGFQWKATGFRWLFSSKCSTLSDLTVSKAPCLSQHIAVCPYAKSTVDHKKYSTSRQFVFGISKSNSAKSFPA